MWDLCVAYITNQELVSQCFKKFLVQSHIFLLSSIFIFPSRVSGGSQLLEKLFSGYDNAVRPNFGKLIYKQKLKLAPPL